MALSYKTKECVIWLPILLMGNGCMRDVNVTRKCVTSLHVWGYCLWKWMMTRLSIKLLEARVLKISNLLYWGQKKTMSLQIRHFCDVYFLNVMFASNHGLLAKLKYIWCLFYFNKYILGYVFLVNYYYVY